MLVVIHNIDTSIDLETYNSESYYIPRIGETIKIVTTFYKVCNIVYSLNSNRLAIYVNCI